MKRMKKNSLIAVLLVLAVLFCACGGKNEPETTTTETVTEPQNTETTKTVNTKDEVKEMVTAFFEKLMKADPVSMTTILDGEEASVFIKDGTKMYSHDVASDVTYYFFEENGVQYGIYDGETAYEDQMMYALYSASVDTFMNMFLTAYFEVEESDGDFAFEGTRTDRTENGVASSELVYSVSGSNEDGEATVKISAKADGEGNVSDLVYEAKSGEEEMKFEFAFAYDVTVELPEYTIGTDGGSGASIDWQYEAVESPYATIKDAIDEIGDEDIGMVNFGDAVYAYFEKDGHYYQLKGDLSEEIQAEFEALDFMDEDYDEKTKEIYGKVEISECLDYTASIPAKEELDACVGKTIGELIEEGFEGEGWSMDEELTEVDVFVGKDGFSYHAVVTLPDDFDTEAEFGFDELSGAVVTELSFTEVQFYLLPIQ